MNVPVKSPPCEILDRAHEELAREHWHPAFRAYQEAFANANARQYMFAAINGMLECRQHLDLKREDVESLLEAMEGMLKYRHQLHLLEEEVEGLQTTAAELRAEMKIEQSFQDETIPKMFRTL
jgi:hypothetical protein